MNSRITQNETKKTERCRRTSNRNNRFYSRQKDAYDRRFVVNMKLIVDEKTE